tara:strand:- start:73 stop:744 length:672 start_codon:yes stop_codon:yes gene_type:complete
MIKEYIYIMKNTFKKKSLNRILQEIQTKNEIAYGKVVEFGGSKNSSKNFTNFINLKENDQIIYSDKFPKQDSIRKEDLEKNLSFETNSIDSILIFNVLEHVFDVNNAFSEINRCLKNNGKIIGSTPFIHRIHGAPNDYNRYTKQFLEKVLENNNYKNIKVKNLGFGPFTSCYSIVFDYFKFIPFLNNLVLSLCFVFDFFINLIVKTDLKDIYPIAIFFSGEKK